MTSEHGLLSAVPPVSPFCLSDIEVSPARRTLAAACAPVASGDANAAPVEDKLS